MSAPFDPIPHLSRVGGADYLEVKWRLVWFRDVHPDGVIVTELLEHEPGKHATFSATVVAENNGGQATGHGSESVGDFRDYLEKAETKALGRALAALGFGTQFAPDLEHAPRDAMEGSPRARRVVNGRTIGPGGGPVPEGQERASGTPQGTPLLANPGQLIAIQSLWTLLRPELSAPDGPLTHHEAARLIRELEHEKKARKIKG